MTDLKITRPFWYDMNLNFRQLYWLQMFYESRYCNGPWEIEVPDGKLIFYKDGTVRLINKTFES